jgi:hypothetical protein
MEDRLTGNLGTIDRGKRQTWIRAGAISMLLDLWLCSDRCEIYTKKSTPASRLIHWNPGPSDGFASPRNSPAGRLTIECCGCERQLGVFIKPFTRSPSCCAQTLSPRVVTPQYISALRPVNKISNAIKTAHNSTHQSDHLPENKFAKVQRQSSLPIGTPAQRQIHK